jgi:hypothetical protein
VFNRYVNARGCLNTIKGTLHPPLSGDQRSQSATTCCRGWSAVSCLVSDSARNINTNSINLSTSYVFTQQPKSQLQSKHEKGDDNNCTEENCSLRKILFISKSNFFIQIPVKCPIRNEAPAENPCHDVLALPGNGTVDQSIYFYFLSRFAS